MFSLTRFDGITPPTIVDLEKWRMRSTLLGLSPLWILTVCILLAMGNPFPGVIDKTLQILLLAGFVVSLFFALTVREALQELEPLVVRSRRKADITLEEAEQFFRDNPQYAHYLYAVRAQNREMVCGDFLALRRRLRADTEAEARKRFDGFTV